MVLLRPVVWLKYQKFSRATGLLMNSDSPIYSLPNINAEFLVIDQFGIGWF